MSRNLYIFATHYHKPHAYDARNMKKQLLLLAMILLPLVASAHDIEVQNADGKTIYYNYINNGTELAVTFCGRSYDSYSNDYQGNVAIPEEVIYMNRTRKVTSIESSAFAGCSGLTSVTIGNSVTSIGDYAFEGCSGLTSVTIPNSVTSIGTEAFSCCFGLTSVTIGSGVTSIGESAFEDCYKLTSITIPNSVTSIGDEAFQYCYGLTSVTIPNSVTSIGNDAFYRCFGLTSITIPNSVTSIGNYAFDGVDLTTVVSLIENPFVIEGKSSSYSAFNVKTFNNATLYVPVGTIDKYKATNGWKDFAYIVEGTPTGIKVIENTQKKNAVYDLNGVRLSEPKKGINIVNGQKVVMK